MPRSVDSRPRVTLHEDTAKIIAAIKKKYPQLNMSDAINQAIRLGGMKMEISQFNENTDTFAKVADELSKLNLSSNKDVNLEPISQTMHTIHKIVYQLFALQRRFVQSYDSENSTSVYTRFESDLQAQMQRTNGRNS